MGLLDAMTGEDISDCIGETGVPGLSILACLYIMKDLSPTTVHVFTVWMTCAVLIYLIYGLRNSNLNRSAH